MATDARDARQSLRIAHTGTAAETTILRDAQQSVRIAHPGGVDAPVRVWTGTAFVDAAGVKTWNGSAFVDSV
jgi:hypothetical protein